jgi:hypothetical protein
MAQNVLTNDEVVTGSKPKSIYYIKEYANVVVVGTDISFKICHGKKPASRQSIDIS